MNDNVLFDKYLKEVLKKEPKKKSEVYEVVENKNFNYISVIGILVILTDLFWIVLSTLSKEVSIINSFLLPFLICRIVFSIYMVIMAFKRDKFNKLVKRISFLLYYLVIVAAVIGINIEQQSNIGFAPVNDKFQDISLATLSVFIFVFIPLPRLIDSVIIVIASIISLAMPIAFVKNGSAPLFQYLVLISYFIVTYVFYYKFSNKLALKEIEVDNLNDQLLEMAYVDTLTKCLNRRALDEYWNILKYKNVDNIGVIFFDIDNFKIFNDKYSYSEGDKALVRVASSAKKFAYENNNYLFRYGGEEFIMLLENVSDKELIEYGLKINNYIYQEKINRNDGTNFDLVTITVGLSKILKEELLDIDYAFEADKALYKGKSSGKNCVIYGNNIFKN